jgi:hypothetical protein
MNLEVFHSRLSDIYNKYNNTIKPLIADIEARQQQFPDSLFNEIRALNDHIARCYIKGFADDRVEVELKNAEGHVYRITLDCYKYLNIWFCDYIKEIDKDYISKLDITLIDNGMFAIQYRNYQKEAITLIRDAKKSESIDKQKSFDLYQKAYNTYSELEKLIDTNISSLNWAKFRKGITKIGSILVWIISIIISSLVTIFVGCDWIKSFFLSLF